MRKILLSALMAILLITEVSANDIEMRLYIKAMTELLGQPFLMDYKVGAGGVIGSAEVAKATTGSSHRPPQRKRQPPGCSCVRIEEGRDRDEPPQDRDRSQAR